MKELMLIITVAVVLIAINMEHYHAAKTKTLQHQLDSTKRQADGLYNLLLSQEVIYLPENTYEIKDRKLIVPGTIKIIDTDSVSRLKK